MNFVGIWKADERNILVPFNKTYPMIPQPFYTNHTKSNSTSNIIPFHMQHAILSKVLLCCKRCPNYGFATFHLRILPRILLYFHINPIHMICYSHFNVNIVLLCQKSEERSTIFALSIVLWTILYCVYSSKIIFSYVSLFDISPANDSTVASLHQSCRIRSTILKCCRGCRSSVYRAIWKNISSLQI